MNVGMTANTMILNTKRPSHRTGCCRTRCQKNQIVKLGANNEDKQKTRRREGWIMEVIDISYRAEWQCPECGSDMSGNVVDIDTITLTPIRCLETDDDGKKCGFEYGIKL
jgi:hypothetical protein